MNKPVIKYTIGHCKNPITGEVMQRPIITDREIYTEDMAVQRGIDSGYNRGQFHDVRAGLDGQIATWQQLVKEGKSVNIGKWFRLDFRATGTVGEDRQLTARNRLKLVITPLEDLKVTADDYEWVCVDDTSALIKVDRICSAGGKDNIILKGKAIQVSGRRIVYDATWGDKISVSYEGLATPIVLTPSEQGEDYLRFEWPTALADVEDGTILTFSFIFHGKEGGAEQPQSLYPIFKVA